MRKKNLAPKIHLLVLTTMISMMLFGCGNSQAEAQHFYQKHLLRLIKQQYKMLLQMYYSQNM